MLNGLIRVDVNNTHFPQVDQNKRFSKMVKIIIMFNDGGG
jgi:hypothetical protein